MRRRRKLAARALIRVLASPAHPRSTQPRAPDPPRSQGNIDKVRANVAKQLAGSLQAMIDAELAEGLVAADAAAGGKWDASTACALTWLKRALRFLEGLLNSFVSDTTKVRKQSRGVQSRGVQGGRAVVQANTHESCMVEALWCRLSAAQLPPTAPCGQRGSSAPFVLVALPCRLSSSFFLAFPRHLFSAHEKRGRVRGLLHTRARSPQTHMCIRAHACQPSSTRAPCLP